MVYTLINACKLLVALVAFYGFYRSLSKKKHVYLSFFGIGFLYNIVSLSFFYSFLPGEWTASIPFQYTVVTFFILVASLFSSLSFLIVPFLFTKIKERGEFSVWKPLLFGFFFTLADISRSILLSLFYLGKESSVGLRLFLGSLGETLTFTPLSLFAYKGGVYILTGILAILSYLLFSFVRKELSKPSLTLSLSFLLIWFFIILLIPRTPLPQLSVDIVTTRFQNPREAHTMEDYTARYKELSSLFMLATSTKTTKDILILPESTYYLSLQEYFDNKRGGGYSYILDSGNLRKQNGRFAYSFFYDTKNDITEVRGKDDLMIFNEYSSYFADFFYSLTASTSTTDTYHQKISTKRGDSYNLFHIENTPYSFAVLLCSEATSFTPLFLFEKERPSFYVLQSNLAVMKEKPLALYEYYNYSKLIALTTGKPVIAVTNMAPSFLYDGYGTKVRTMDTKTALIHLF